MKKAANFISRVQTDRTTFSGHNHYQPALAGHKAIIATVDRGQQKGLRGYAWLSRYRVWLFGKAEEIQD